MKRWLALGVLVGIAVRASADEQAAPGTDCAPAIAARVQAYYDGVRDLRARFVQTTRQVALGGAPAQSLEARGEVVFAKPGRMRWSYETPSPSLAVSDGKTLWLHDPEAREVQELALGPDFLSGAAIQFLLGEGRLLDEFGVGANHCGDPQVALSLTPRREAPYERIELRADAASGVVRETTVTDLLGNRTTVALTDVRLDTSPDPALFRFVAPEGTRVLSLEPAR